MDVLEPRGEEVPALVHGDDGGEDGDGLDGARRSVQLEAGVHEPRAEAHKCELWYKVRERREPLVHVVLRLRLGRRRVCVDDDRLNDRLTLGIRRRARETPSRREGRATRRR